MENAPKDILFTIGMDLDLPDLLKWCSSSSRINKNVCQNDNIWRSKLLKDFPDFEKFNLNRSLRETYVFLYQLSYIKKHMETSKSLQDILRLKTISLTGKNLKNVPSFDLPNLKRLYLYSNNLTKVPAFSLPNLTILFLNDNQLTEIPAFNLPNLKVLSMAGNYLTKISELNFPKLEDLSLYNNKLTEISEFNLPNLRALNLTRNPLTDLTKKKLKQKYGNKVAI
jgi:Leucine-rich repeat (LRR) protein